jgi:hypothetical protein
LTGWKESRAVLLLGPDDLSHTFLGCATGNT